MAEQRNVYAHGVWLKEPKTNKVYIRNISGRWKREPRSKKVRRALYPTVSNVSPALLRKWALIVKEANLALQKIEREVKNALQAKPKPYPKKHR